MRLDYTGPLITFPLALLTWSTRKWSLMMHPKQRARPGRRGWMPSYIEESFAQRISRLRARCWERRSPFTRNLLTIAYHPSLLEVYTSCRLIPLDKSPGIRPIGVGEVLRRIVGKTVAGFLKEEIKEAAGPLQVCAGHRAGSEAAINATSQVFAKEGTDGILLIDASNAVNQSPYITSR